MKAIRSELQKRLTRFEPGTVVLFRFPSLVPKWRKDKTEVQNRGYMGRTKAVVSFTHGHTVDIQFPNGAMLYGIPVRDLGIWHDNLPTI